MYYQQLTKDERYQIKACLQIGMKQVDIAKLLKRSPATITRKIKRNMSGFLRQYFPKKTPLKDNGVRYVRVKAAADKLNSRPIKCLSYKTPFEVFYSMID